MNNRVLESNPFGSVSEDDVQAFELQTGLTLPDDYKKYLVSFNGGSFQRNCFWTRENPDTFLVLRDLYSLNCGPSYRHLNECWNLAKGRDLKQFADGLSQYIEIGDAHGCGLLLDTASGAVLMYDPDHLHLDTAKEVVEIFEFVASSFGEFVTGLISEGEAARRFAD